MNNPNNIPNCDAYEAQPDTHEQIMQRLHRIGHTSLDQIVKLRTNLIEQGNSEELAGLLTAEPEIRALYI